MNRKKTEAKTRRKLLEHLKLTGGLPAETLARHLGISGMGVRQHLYALVEEGLVTYFEEARPVGRPAKVWRLSDAADAFFPDGHQDLAVDLIAALGKLFGEEGMNKLLRERLQKQLAQYTTVLAQVDSLPEKLAALSEQRTREGYMASWEKLDDGSYLLIESHCPICSAARACQGLCAMELELFTTVLGAGVSVERSDYLLAGARRCAYLVREVELLQS